MCIYFFFIDDIIQLRHNLLHYIIFVICILHSTYWLGLVLVCVSRWSWCWWRSCCRYTFRWRQHVLLYLSVTNDVTAMSAWLCNRRWRWRRIRRVNRLVFSPFSILTCVSKLCLYILLLLLLLTLRLSLLILNLHNFMITFYITFIIIIEFCTCRLIVCYYCLYCSYYLYCCIVTINMDILSFLYRHIFFALVFLFRVICHLNLVFIYYCIITMTIFVFVCIHDAIWLFFTNYILHICFVIALPNIVIINYTIICYFSIIYVFTFVFIIFTFFIVVEYHIVVVAAAANQNWAVVLNVLR